MASKTKLFAFLFTELFLYGAIMISGGLLLRICEFVSIVFCFLFAILSGREGSRLIMAGLGFTVAADFCLVICSPAQQLWGMVFFLAAQTLYAILLHSQVKNKSFLILRFMVILLAVTLTVIVLGKNTDALALISLCYYANLIVNIVLAFCSYGKEPLFPIALVLFLMCDTVIGLQVASGSYLPIREISFLYRLIFMDFNLAWFFYLPSQVLIALCGSGFKARRKRSMK